MPNETKMFVPIDALEQYCKAHPEWRNALHAEVVNVGKKSNFKVFVKRLKKAVEYLPSGMVVEVNIGKLEEKE